VEGDMTNEATATVSPNETVELAKAGQVLKLDRRRSVARSRAHHDAFLHNG
jgi:hypothetical protein